MTKQKTLKTYVSEFGKVSGYKPNIQKSISFLGISNELEIEVLKVPLTTAHTHSEILICAMSVC